MADGYLQGREGLLVARLAAGDDGDDKLGAVSVPKTSAEPFPGLSSPSLLTSQFAFLPVRESYICAFSALRRYLGRRSTPSIREPVPCFPKHFCCKLWSSNPETNLPGFLDTTGREVGMGDSRPGTDRTSGSWKIDLGYQ